MTNYRLFFINDASGHIERAEIVQACDDDQAVLNSEGRTRLQTMELWHLARKVRVFDKVAEPKKPLRSAVPFGR